MLLYNFLAAIVLIKHATAEDKNNTKSLLNFDNNACYQYYQYPLYPISKSCFVSPFVLKDTPRLITLNNYKYKSYDVTTDDGYIITIFRVFKDTPKGRPIYVQHGIATESSAWVQNGKENSLAFVLVDQGFDVWLGNLRVTPYGKRHVTLSTKDSKFWDFSLDDMAAYDLRNCLQKVAEITGQAGEIIYVGHSMGSTLLFMYASSFPADNLIKGIYLFSPIAYFKDIMRPGFGVLKVLATFLRSFNVNSVLYHDQLFHKILSVLCKYVPYICQETINLSSGRSSLYLPEQLITYLSYYPDTIGLKQGIHYCQIGVTGKFQKYDYGSKENMRRYKQNEPPLYDLSKITLPTFLFYGKNDALVTSETANKVFKQLGSKVKDLQQVPIDDFKKEHQFGHVQYLIGANITQLFFNDFVKYLEKLN